MGKMKGLYFPGNKKVEIKEFDIPVPGKREVLVEIEASALCRSDMSLYYGTSVFGEKTSDMIIPGHEPAGVVRSIGDDVSVVKEGDRVAIYLGLGCNKCEFCKRGQIVFCKDFKCIGFDVSGGDAEYILVPEENCLKIPDDMSFVTAALSTDAVGSLYHAEKRLGVSGKDIVALFGIGPMGGAGVMVAKAMGAKVIAIDSVKNRLDLAKELGADYCIDFSKQDTLEEIDAITKGVGADIAIDCTGNSIAENNALSCLKPHGRAAFIGENTACQIDPSNQFIRKEISLIGSWYFPIDEYDEIARFIMNNNLPVEKLVTHRFDLEDAAEAFELFDSRQTQKVVFVKNNK